MHWPRRIGIKIFDRKFFFLFWKRDLGIQFFQNGLVLEKNIYELVFYLDFFDQAVFPQSASDFVRIPVPKSGVRRKVAVLRSLRFHDFYIRETGYLGDFFLEFIP